MRQYLDAKQQHRDAILFFRMGDFYEMFFEDALVAARALDLTLTSRAKDAAGGAIPMCGLPFHAADSYIARLVRLGHRVAICEQVEDPKKAKGVVRREVVRVVSPGTFTDSGALEPREPAFLVALATASDGPSAPVGLAMLDLSTGEFSVTEFAGEEASAALADELSVIRPREVLIPGVPAPDGAMETLRADWPVLRDSEALITPVDPSAFVPETARQALRQQLQETTLETVGLDGRDHAVSAAGGLLHYLRVTQRADLGHIRRIGWRTRADALVIDPTTLRHLELVTGTEGGRQGSVLDAIDRTATAMGGRLLRAWLLAPLVSVEAIRDRLDAVEALAFRTTERGKFQEAIKQVHDLERLVGRAAMGIAGPRDLAAIGRSLAALPRVRTILSDVEAPLVRRLVAALDDLPTLRHRIESTLVDEPPALARDGGMIRDGCDGEIDDLRTTSRSGRQIIAEMEERERTRTGIQSLKIRYNRVFGYYIEISNANLRAVPDDYLRKQTIAGGERFVTPDLKTYEERILGADELILAREVALFDALRLEVAAAAVPIQATARALATLDVLAGLADTATVCNYTKPYVHDGDEMVVLDARHPVVERRTAGTGDAYVPNDIVLNGTTQQLVILTGPNMGGKSTYLRQTALVCVLAQIGSFVPAREAKLAVVDRIFARVGASDNIARGQSTFMVEMQETANILHSATARSLVVLDEIGRGTATFDGLSIAWAVAEHLATHPTRRPKTLFATHYHELTDLADATPGVVNFHVAAREWKDEIVFLRKIVAGRSDRSYGIQVARLAGLPPSVIERAQRILAALERDELTRGGRPAVTETPDAPQQQLGLFQAPSSDGFRARLAALDLDRLTPLEALLMLTSLKQDAQA